MTPLIKANARAFMVTLAVSLPFHANFAQTVDLGLLTATNILASSQESLSYPIEEAFNGITRDGSDGWLATTSVDRSASWDFNPYENTQVDTGIYQQIQLSITIYSGYHIDDLNHFAFRVADADQTFSNYVTNFDNLASQQNYFFENTKTLAIESDAFGMITAENPSAELSDQTVHSIVFTAPHSTRKIELFIPEGENGSFHFTIQEIELSATAIPVPEVSTYSLLLGLGALSLITFKRRFS